MKRTMGKTIITFALVLSLVLSLGGLAFAEENPNKLVINKTLAMNEGAELLADYTFDFTVTGIPTAGSDNAMPPAITIGSLEFTQAGMPAAVAGVVSGSQSTADILASVTWPHAGIFTYRIAEVDKSATYNDEDSEITFDATVYEIDVYVAQGDSGLEVVAVIAFNVDPLTDERAEKIEDGIDTDAGSLTLPFANKYRELIGDDDDDDDDEILNGNGWRVSKAVDGEFASELRQFSFTITAKLGALSTLTTETLVVFDAEGEVTQRILLADNYNPATRTATMNITLAHDEVAVFTRLDAGTEVTVVEGDYTADNYYASVNGVDGLEFTTLITKDAVNAAYLNEHRITDPTGVLVAALPFAALIAVVAGAVVLSSRKRDEIA